MQSTRIPLTLAEYRDLDRLLADAPDLRAKILPAHRPQRSFVTTIREVDLTKPHALVVGIGLGADVSNFPPLVDHEGFPMRLATLNFLTPDELVEIREASAKRLQPFRRLIGQHFGMATEAEWGRSLTPFIVIEGDAFLDFRSVMRAAEVPEVDKRGSLTAECRNLLASTATVDPSLTAAWVDHEHAFQLGRINGAVVVSEEPLGAIERLLIEHGIAAANKSGDTFASHRAWWAKSRATATSKNANKPVEVTP